MTRTVAPDTVITIRCERELGDRIGEAAKRERMSRPQWLLRLAERELERREKESAA